jgi:uncharacterized repeat protein (TIGR01451 family)
MSMSPSRLVRHFSTLFAVIVTFAGTSQAAQVSASSTGTFVLQVVTGGTVWAWGNNGSGQLGDGTFINHSIAEPVSGISSITAVAAGGSHSLALKSDGTVWAWGANFNGQLGNGTFNTSPTPAQVPGLAGIVAIAAGQNHSLALKSDGTLWAWGVNAFGQIGDGTSGNNRLSPVAVTTTGFTNNIIAIAAGQSHSLAITTGGGVWAWGQNSNGQIGDGTTVNKPVPTAITLTSCAAGAATAIAGGNLHTLAVVGGAVCAWGTNLNGELGDGTTTQRNSPVATSTLTSGITAVSAGNVFSLALKSDNTVWAWGGNAFGQLGDTTLTQRMTPVQASGVTGAVEVAAGSNFSVAHTSGDSLLTWGSEGQGQLGDGISDIRPVPIPIAGLSGVTQASAGNGHTLALLTGGTVMGLGNNSSGQLGNNSTTRALTPVTVSGLSNITAVSAGNAHSLALRNDGTVWAWGFNSNGQLGNNTTTQEQVPVQVVGVGNVGFLSSIAAISASGSNNHSLAVSNTGVVYAWGLNNNGQLGDGTTTQRLAPVVVSGLSGIFTAVSAGNNHSLALRNDGTVWAWGNNNSGQIGDGTFTQHLLPVQVPGLTGITAISANAGGSLALKSDGSMWAWGNSYPYFAPQLTPTVNPDVGPGPLSISDGNGYSLFTGQLAGSVIVGGWGANNNGQLGNGTFSFSGTVPTLGFGGKTPSSVSANAFSLAVMTDGTVWGWGFDGQGQLGDSPTIFNPTPTAPVARGAADLSVTKSHVGSFSAGLPASYTITVKNVGQASVAGTITVTDTLPSGMSFASGSGPGWTCGAITGGASCTNPGPLAAGASSVITLNVNTTALMFPDQFNLATVANASDPQALNNASSDETSVPTPTTVTLTPAPSPNPSTYGQVVSLTATVTPSTATGYVVFADAKDSGTFLGAVPVSSGTAHLTTIMLNSGSRQLEALFTPGSVSPYNFSFTATPTLQTVNAVASGPLTPFPSSPLILGGSKSGYLVATGDFNGDGKMDIAAMDSGSHTVTIYLGNGSGGFTPSIGGPFQTGSSPVAIAAVDLNGDGKVDLAIANQGGLNSLTVLLGNGAGAFAAAPGSPFAVGFTPTSLAFAGDFNNDGTPRVAVAGLTSTQFTKLKRDQFGNFYIDTFPLPLGSRSGIASGDFNGDGNFDLAVSDIAGTVGINLKDPNGGYFPLVSIPSTLPHPQGIVAADFNGDGKTDLATFDATGIEILIGNGSGGFAEASGSPFVPGTGSITGISSLSVGDFNGDGIPDLFVVRTPTSTAKGEVVIMLGNGSGGFAQAIGWGYTSGSSNLLNAAVANFNGDGRTEVAVTDPVNDGVVVLEGTGPRNQGAVGVLRDSTGAIRLGAYASSVLSSSGGSFASDPGVAEDLAGNQFVTARDNFNAIWTNIFLQGTATWAGWQSGGGTTVGVPAIAVATSGTAWIAARDASNSYWLVSYTNGIGYGPWTALHGTFAIDPVITACGDGSLYIVGKDASNAMWSMHYIPGGSAASWAAGGGTVTGKASITCGGDNAMYLVARDASNSNWIARVTGTTWTWNNGGAQTTNDPQIAALGNGSEAVVILGAGGAVWRNTFTEGVGNNWQTWTSVGGTFSDIAPAGVSGELFFIAKSLSNDLWWWNQTGNVFTWINNNGVAAGALAAAAR